MGVMEFTASNFMPKDLEIICIHERGEKCHSCKVIQERNYFTLISALDKLFGSIGYLRNLVILNCVTIVYFHTFYASFFL